MASAQRGGTWRAGSCGWVALFVTLPANVWAECAWVLWADGSVGTNRLAKTKSRHNDTLAACRPALSGRDGRSADEHVDQDDTVSKQRYSQQLAAHSVMARW